MEGSKSCGQCIKIPSCAWCLDPRSNSSQRCDLKTAFTPETCAPHYVYSPATEIKIAPQHVRFSLNRICIRGPSLNGGEGLGSELRGGGSVGKTKK